MKTTEKFICRTFQSPGQQFCIELAGHVGVVESEPLRLCHWTQVAGAQHHMTT